MAYDIGPKIGIEGEKEFRESINQINTKMRTLDTEMKVVASQFDKNDKSTEALTAKNGILNKQIDEQKNKLSELSKGLAIAAEKYGDNDKVTQGWQQAVNKATADLNNMERELDSNNKSLNEFGNEADQATEKTGKFSGALGGLKEGLKNVGGAVGKAAIAGIKAVGTAAIAAGAGALKMAVDVGKTADNLITLSNQTGISTKTLQEWEYASRFVDVSVETMSKGLAKVTKATGEAANANSNYIQIADGLKVSIRDSNGQLKSSEEIFYASIDALGQMTNETERDIAAQELFGKSFQEINPLIKAGSDELKKLGEEANKVGAVLSDDTLAAAGKFDDMMETLGASAKGLTANIGVAVLPAVTEVVNSVVQVVPKITAAIKTGDWEGAAKAVTDGLNGLLEKITAALPGLMTMASSILGGLVSAIVATVPEVLPPLIDATIMLLNTLITILKDNGPMLITAGMEALMMLIEGLISALPELMDAAIEILMSLVDNIMNLLPELIPAALALIVALANGLIDNLPKLIERIPTIVETIVNVIVENLPLIIDAALKIVMALARALIENLPLIIESVIRIIGAILEALLGGIVNIITFVPKLFSTLVGEFGKINWGELGINIIKGIVAGVTAAAKNLAGSVVDAAKGALGGAKKFLGIQSPSKVFREQVGNMMGAGMALGILDSAKEVDAAMNGLNKKLVTDVRYNFESKSSGIENNSLINIDVPVVLDGQIISKSSGRIQRGKNRTRSRALGVTV